MQHELFNRPTGLEFYRAATDTWLKNHSQALAERLKEYEPGYKPRINIKTGRPYQFALFPHLVDQWKRGLALMNQVIAEREAAKNQ